MELETADLNQLADDVVEDVLTLRKMAGGQILDFRSFADSMKIIQVDFLLSHVEHVKVEAVEDDHNYQMSHESTRVGPALYNLLCISSCGLSPYMENIKLPVKLL